MTLDGHTGKQARYMGVFELSTVKANGAPRFVKQLASGAAHYLYRTSNQGTWVVTPDESAIATAGTYMDTSGSDASVLAERERPHDPT